MLLNVKVFLLAMFFADVVFCEIKADNSTVTSRREIIEQQARTAYQNACYRMQELSNWMTAVFRIKSVWASATVNELASRSEGMAELDRRSKLGLPTRPKTVASECSLSSVQVTAQTYAYLQSQIVMMKWLLGRNIFKSSKERLGGAKENMKLLETFNSTLNGVVSKLKQSTVVNTSTTVDSEASGSRNIEKFPTESGRFFQNLGKNLDKLLFPLAPLTQEAAEADTVAKDEHSVTSVEKRVSKDENSAASIQNPVAKEEQSVSNIVTPVEKNEPSVDDTENPFTKKVHSASKVVYSVAEEPTNNAIMFSSIF